MDIHRSASYGSRIAGDGGMNMCFSFPTFALFMLSRDVLRFDGAMLMAGFSSGNLRSQLDLCGWS